MPWIPGQVLQMYFEENVLDTGQNNFITVVSGLPRSGTSMMMRMLESGGIPVLTDGFRKADEDNPRGYYEFEAVKRMDKDASWLPHALGKAVKVIYVLLYALPADQMYKVIFMRRNLNEVIASQKVMLRRRQEQSSLSPEQLAGSFDEQLQKLYSWMERKSNFEILYLDYDNVLGQPGQTVSEISRFLDLRLDTDAMMGVIDPSLYRNRSAAFESNCDAMSMPR